jgi:hypothetical protein
MNPFEIIQKLKQLQEQGVEVIFSSEIAEDKITIQLKNGLPTGVYIPLKVIPKIVKVFKEEWKKKL